MLKKMSVFTVFRFCPALILILFFTSCTDTRKIPYFYGVEEGSIATRTSIPESVIQKNDILSIIISSPNPEASQIFNNSSPATWANSSGVGSSSIGNSQGYLVNTDGSIQFPLIGSIKAEGLTKNQLKDKISSIILEKKLLIDPIVTIRFVNFRVTVLGEVNHPTVVSVPNEKISLLEAIGLAGDLTLYAKKQNVMVIREEKDRKIIKRLDLNSTELLTSPYYYLQSNDIVYVEPNKAKVASTNRSTQWLPIFLSGLSLAAIVADRLIK
jgi:polysaccharide export outer membrane protein